MQENRADSLRVLCEAEFDLFGEEDAKWEDPPR